MADFVVPDWPAPANVRAFQTTRSGGCSFAPWDSLNLGDHVGDSPEHVIANRAILRDHLPAEPLWLNQVHGIAAVDAEISQKTITADAAFSRRAGVVCAVMTADCLPVLFCDRAGTVVAAAHAGWRGLQAGVLESCIDRMAVAAPDILAWLGPAIGPQAFEVGDEVREAFIQSGVTAESCFVRHGSGKWLADIYRLARQRLTAKGLTAIYGGNFCTMTDARRFFSYRRDGVTGRMATLIWLAPTSVV